MSLWASVLFYGATTLVVAITGLYLYSCRKYNYWRNKGVKYIKPAPFVGAMKDMIFMRKHLGEVLKDIYDEHRKDPFIGLYAFDEPVLQINDINLVKSVLIKDFQYFTDHNFAVSAKVDPLGSRGLFSLKGDRWKQSRSAITPSFTSGKMKRMYEIIAECGDALYKAIEKETEAPIVAYELIARYTTDVIASCAFGIESNTLENPQSEFRAMLRKVLDLSPIEAVKFLMCFLAPNLVDIMNIKVLNPQAEAYVLRTIKTTIQHREENGIKRNDLLESLVEIMKQGKVDDVPEENLEKTKSKIKMDHYDIAGHSFMFLIAGFETSATTMSYALYELAKNVNAQETLRREIHGALDGNNGKMPYDVLQSMKYMDMVVQETLRKYPPVPFLDRISSKPYVIPGTQIKLETGTVIMVPVLAIQRDPEFYPDPMKFDPERFTEENKATRPQCTHVPFGDGPRACVGLRFALLQTKIGLVNFLKNHSVHMCSSTPQEITLTTKSFLAQPTEHFKLLFKRLENAKY